MAKIPSKFKDLEETRFLHVLHMPNVMEEYPIKKLRGVKDSNHLDITIYDMKNTKTGNVDALDALIKDPNNTLMEGVPTITFRVNKEAKWSIMNIKNTLWIIFPSKKELITYLEAQTGKNIILK